MQPLRSLAKSPGFTVVALLTLALGIGTTTTVFSWIERVLLQPLPGVADVSRIVALETRSASGELIDTSFPDFRDYQAQARSFSGMLVFKERPLNLGTGANAERVWSELVSADFFSVLGVRPHAGRFFIPADQVDAPGAAPVVVISEALWRRRFAADPEAIGRTVKLNQHDFTVIGVAPAEFLGTINGLAFDVWVPIGAHARLLGPSRWLETRGWHTLARLAPGATPESARAELDALAAQFAVAEPGVARAPGFAVLPVARSPYGIQRELGRPLLLLLGVCGLLLFIVCANLSNLLLVRASARQRELRIRQALGASPWRLVRESLAEGLALSAGGALLACLLTLWTGNLLRNFIPDAALPVSLAAGVSGRVFALAVAVAVLTTVIAGLAPALWAARGNAMEVLRASSRAGAITRRADLFRRALAIAQVALAFVTLAAAALATKSFFAAKRTHPGFDAAGVLLAALKFDASGYTRAQALDLLDRLQPRLAALPGVESAALGENVPLGLSRGSWEEVSPPGYLPAPQENMHVYRNLISPGYFSLMRIPLLGGRDFTDADRDGAPRVAIVNETFARRYLGASPAEAIGRTFSTGRGQRVLTIVGVARDIKVHSLGESALPYYYLPVRQALNRDTGLAVHLRVAAGDPLALLPALRQAMRDLDPEVPIFEALTLEDYTSAARFAQKAAASLLAVLSALALALTSLGLYGVLAFTVAQRAPEIGVRLALGAQHHDIARLILARGAVLIAAGVALGLVAALALAHSLAALLYGVRAFEPALLLAVTALVTACALAACLIPARRATRIDPLSALRAE